MHSMREENENAIDAMRRRDEFIDGVLTDAKRFADEGHRNEALDRLGEACHPIMDSSSPMHTNPDGTPMAWNPRWPFGHSPNEWIGNETIQNLTPEILDSQTKLLNNAFKKVFGP